MGLALAALLRSHGMAVRIIDKSAGPTPWSKAIGMHARTLESMHALGLTARLLDDGFPMRGFRVNEAGRTILSARFDEIGSPYGFVLGLPQSRTERRLLDRLEELGGEVEWGTALAAIEEQGDPAAPGRPAVIRITHADGREERVECNWLVGADGSRSAVRDMAGIGFPGGDFGKAFILGDVAIDWDGPKSELQFFLSAKGYLLVVPMPGGMHRIIAQTDRRYTDFQGDARPEATLEELQCIVDANGPGGIRVHSPQWLTCAPFYHRLAETALRQRVILAGDAFHLFSPLGAQGLNTGLQDAFNLAWKLAYVERGWAQHGLLQTYRSEREAIARRIAEVTAKTTRFITDTSLPRRLLRRLLTPLFNRGSRVQKQLPRLLAGMLQTYGEDGALAGDGASGLPPPGGRIPHAWLSQGDACMPLASLVHGTQFTLLLLKDRLDAQAHVELQQFDEAMGARHPFLQIVVVTRETAGSDARLPAGWRMADDRDGSVLHALAADGKAMLLSRPDGYCALSSRCWSAEEVEHYFSRRGIAGLPQEVRNAA
ncbi:hypothetical protein AYR66_12825 [Noviherbaspirillum denitrificans]|uniref:FAD-binding domain-containing protein n=1 Tax=Noviherbaspirillum denitrificans TaxID=1968433 RepID=A0A254TC61_9BURK|nr:hypothetical protein AYR66_12825 [Noviherbaspirillum denitrificans]